MSDDVTALYLDAADTFVQLVERVRPHQWSARGLGVWNVRALTGHTSRAMVTVLTYLDRPATTEDVPTPDRYFALIAGQTANEQAVAARGRQAGEALGADPAKAVQVLRDEVADRLRGADPDSVITTIAGGMRVRAYLPTRTFELVVHSLDIARAIGSTVTFAPEVETHVAELAARVAVDLGHGRALLETLTGRRAWPPGANVV